MADELDISLDELLYNLKPIWKMGERKELQIMALGFEPMIKIEAIRVDQGLFDYEIGDYIKVPHHKILKFQKV